MKYSNPMLLRYSPTYFDTQYGGRRESVSPSIASAHPTGCFLVLPLYTKRKKGKKGREKGREKGDTLNKMVIIIAYVYA